MFFLPSLPPPPPFLPSLPPSLPSLHALLLHIICFARRRPKIGAIFCIKASLSAVSLSLIRSLIYRWSAAQNCSIVVSVVVYTATTTVYSCTATVLHAQAIICVLTPAIHRSTLLMDIVTLPHHDNRSIPIVSVNR